LDAVIVRRLMKTKRQTILPYRIEVTAANDGLTSHAGLPLVAETMRAMGLDQATSDLLNLRKRGQRADGLSKVRINRRADGGWRGLL
jgi:hypothetical protein